MSNIANQLVAVVATLSGFVAHDLLTENSSAPATAAVPALAVSVDPITTRAVSLDGLSVEGWLAASPRAEREPVRAPGFASRTIIAPGRPGALEVETRIADARINGLRFDDPGRRGQSAFLR